MIGAVIVGVTAVLQAWEDLPGWVLWFTGTVGSLIVYTYFYSIYTQKKWSQQQAEIARILASATKSKDQESQAERDREIKAWLSEARLVIPRLPDAALEMLVKLLDNPGYFDKYDPYATVFKTKNYIRQLVAIPGKGKGAISVLYELQPSLQGVVGDAYRDRCDAKVRALLDDARKAGHYQKALEFFAVPMDQPLPWPEPLSEELKSLYYDGWNSLAGRVLDRERRTGSGVEIYSVQERYRAPIEKHFLAGKPIQREKVAVDLSKVPALVRSGSGA